MFLKEDESDWNFGVDFEDVVGVEIDEEGGVGFL